MKTKLSIIALFLVLVSGRAWSQSTVTAEVFAEVIIALTAQENQPLSFGRFSPESTGGSIVVSPDGMRLTQGAIITTGTGFSPASFFVTGQTQAQFEVILPEGPIQLFRDGSSETMTVRDWRLEENQNILILENGTRLVNIGATLDVGSLEENPTGMYSGTYPIIFLYY